MRAAIYARVSTADQNCEMQLKELRKYCSRRGWTFTREYVDTDWGNGRPEFDRLMKDAALQWFDLVVVWRPDRFGRSVRHSTQKLRALSSWGIQFIATNQGFDTRQEVPTNRLLLPIMTAVADFEREMIRERVKAGIDAARKTGVKLGRPKAVFDRKKAPPARLRLLLKRIPDPRQSRQGLDGGKAEPDAVGATAGRNRYR